MMVKDVVMSKFPILITICILFLAGCEGLQVNIPVEFQSVKREESALLVLVENRSSRQVKITYPVSVGMLKPDQHTIFRVSKPGNYKVVVTVYAEDPDYRDVYQPVSTVEIPVFLNGYDIIRAKGAFVGYHLEVTDGMLFPGK